MNNELGGDGPPEINPDIAIIQARQVGPSTSPGSGELPSTAFVASLNGLGGPVTLQSGTVPAGVTVTFTQGAGTISFNLSGIDPISTKKSNLTAVVDPAVGDDSSQGYATGSVWLNTVTPSYWMAVSVAVGAAVWLQIG